MVTGPVGGLSQVLGGLHSRAVSPATAPPCAGMFISIQLVNYRTLNSSIVINNFQELLLYEMDYVF